MKEGTENEVTDTNDLQLDYWIPKKKGEGHKVKKTTTTSSTITTIIAIIARLIF